MPRFNAVQHAMSSPDPAGRPASPGRRRPDLLPVLLLVLIVLAMLGGWWIFPRLHRAIAMQDCTAAGRTDCNGPGH